MLAPESVIAWIIIGAIAGWLAGLLVKGYGFGLIGNIVIGILGAGIAGTADGHGGTARHHSKRRSRLSRHSARPGATKSSIMSPLSIAAPGSPHKVTA